MKAIVLNAANTETRMFEFSAVGVVGVCGIVALYFYSQYKRAEEIEEARIRYQDSLDALKAGPNSSALREQTLALGRTYANLLRDRQGTTIFDEVALKNDIEAACAGIVNVNKGAVEERLNQLARLLQSGYISQSEYQQRRQSIINEV